MKTIARVVIVLLWMPMLLFAWGPDVTVDTLRVSEGGYPVDYDVAWLTDSDMAIEVAINYPNDSAGIRIYRTADQGQTWTNFGEIALGGYQLKNIQAEYWMDVLYILCTTTNGEIFCFV